MPIVRSINRGKLNGLALCSGIGGLELGLELALEGKYRTICHVERDPYAASVLVARMEDKIMDPAPIWDDLKTFQSKKWCGIVDIVSAGYPCQPFSTAGKKKGVEDPRHLWPWVFKIIREVESQIIFLENVPGHIQMGFREVLGDLASIGFNAEWGVFSAAASGAPHLRKRLFILAYKNSAKLRNFRWTSQLGNDGKKESMAHRLSAHTNSISTRQLSSSKRSKDSLPLGHGKKSDVANTRSGISIIRPSRKNKQKSRRIKSTSSCEESDVANTISIRHRKGKNKTAESTPSELLGWWHAEPGMGRVADGIPAQMDRLRCLGNGVVPAVAARAFKTLLARIK